MYSCPCPEPGFLAEPYHIPGYGGHVPSMRARNGGSFGKLAREILEDPCVPQAPLPLLLPPMCPPCGSSNGTTRGYMCGPPPCMTVDLPSCPAPAAPQRRETQSSCCPPPRCSPSPCCDPRRNVGCEDLGCCSGFCCPPPKVPTPRPKPVCEPLPCCEPCDPRAHHLNRGPYVCPCRPEPDTQVYRCCEPLASSYTGHVPGFTFHSNGRTFGKVTWGTKQYMDNCFYYNTFLQ